MTRPLISCIIPAHNAERFLGEAVESALAQTYQPIEVVIVDDGSTDSTADVAGSFANTVRYVHQANAGASAARIRGIEATTGELIALLDADDVWLPEKLDRQATEFVRRPELDALFTYVQNFWIDELREEAERFKDHRIARPLPGYVGGTMMVRRSAFERYGPFELLHHGEVTEWILRARDAGATIDILPDVLTRRRLHQSNLSRVLQDRSRDQFLHIVKAHLDRERDA